MINVAVVNKRGGTEEEKYHIRVTKEEEFEENRESEGVRGGNEEEGEGSQGKVLQMPVELAAPLQYAWLGYL